MTTKQLIAMLQEADPSGELPVCVGNHDVYFVETQPAYYDGCLQQLVHDENKRPYWSIVGGRITSRGMKVDIRTLSIEDAINEMPDMPVTLYGCEHYADAVERWRKEASETA